MRRNTKNDKEKITLLKNSLPRHQNGKIQEKIFQTRKKTTIKPMKQKVINTSQIGSNTHQST